jgi:homospermidine synthase
VLNLSVDVSSTAMVAFCRERGALYLDTVVEPWGGLYFDRALSPAQRSNYALREGCWRSAASSAPAPPPVSAQGANPGLVSQLAKEAALIVARDTGLEHPSPPTARAGRGCSATSA